MNVLSNGDLITLGNGWDYLDYERLHTLSRRYGVRVHGFVHDLIAIDRPREIQAMVNAYHT